MITAIDWQERLEKIGVKRMVALDWRDAFADEVQPERFSSGMDDMLAWLPQILHECDMLQRLEERLSYSPERLVEIWPSRFPSEALAQHYAGNPERLANKVYGDRMGNNQPGDGWRFRGRGPIMLTGRAGYEHVGALIGQSLDSVPELMLEKRYGLEAAIAWWEDRVPDSMLSDQVKVRRKVNGGTIGLAHCQALHAKVLEAFA